MLSNSRPESGSRAEYEEALGKVYATEQKLANLPYQMRDLQARTGESILDGVVFFWGKGKLERELKKNKLRVDKVLAEAQMEATALNEQYDKLSLRYAQGDDAALAEIEHFEVDKLGMQPKGKQNGST